MENRRLKKILGRITKIVDSDNSSMSHADIFENIAYLIILKYLDHLELTEGKTSEFSNWLLGNESPFAFQAERFRWKNWIDLAQDDRTEFIVESVFPYLNSLDGDSLLSNFYQGADFREIDRNLLDSLVEEIDKINFEAISSSERSELASQLIETFLNEDSSKLGQFVTPKALREIMVSLIPNSSNGDVLDPACGTGLLLSDFVNANSTAEKRISQIHGIDISRRMMNFARFNFIMNGYSKGEIFRANSLSEKDKKSLPGIIESYDIIISQPPFGFKLNKADIRSELTLQTTNGPLLFLEFVMKSLRPGGVACIVLSPNLFFASDNASKKLREKLVEKFTPKVIIRLPKKFLSPDHGVRGYVVLFKKSEERPDSSDQIVYWDLDKKSLGDEIHGHIQKVVNWARSGEEGKHNTALPISIKRIRENKYYLNIDRYSARYSREEISKSKEDIINELISKEEEILKKLKSLREKVREL